jgi:hypothetical protein
VEAETDVVGGPVAVGVAERGLEERDGLFDGAGAVGRREEIEDAVAEGVEPGLHTVGERGRARDEVDRVHGEAGGFEQAAVVRG